MLFYDIILNLFIENKISYLIIIIKDKTVLLDFEVIQEDYPGVIHNIASRFVNIIL